MPKSVSTREAKNNLSALIAWAREHSDAVVVENHGKPAAVLVSATQYEKMQAAAEKQRRAEALEALRRLRDEVAERNADLTPQQADELAERATREAIESLIERGRIRFQP